MLVCKIWVRVGQNINEVVRFEKSLFSVQLKEEDEQIYSFLLMELK